MIDLNENVTKEMNKYLEGTTIEEVLLRNRKYFHYKVFFTEEQMQQDVEVLDLTVRAHNCLKRHGYCRLGDLVNGVYTKDESSKRQLLKIRNLGRNTAEEILLKLFYYQFHVLPEYRKGEYMRELVEYNN